ncbi:MAG: outer membrane lipoprotein-sorting protein [Desulfobacula sp.]|nr:outer membrane lipoprotein-sorting protein [Desulfobacula sp.]
MKIVYTIILTIFALNVVQADELTTSQLLDKVDKQFRSDTSTSELEMQIETKNWKRTLKMRMWTKGMEKTLIQIDSPKKDRGISTLKRDKSMWNFFPKINKVIKIPASMMMGSWMGSDFTNDDLVKENTFVDDYTHKFFNKEDKEFYHIEIVPKEETVTVWGKITLKIRKSDNIIAQEVFYSENGEKIKIMEFTDVKIMGGKKIPSTMTLIPLKKKNQRTVIKYLKATFDGPVKDSIFTRKNLQKRR